MSWKEFLREEQSKDYFKLLTQAVQDDAKAYQIFPAHRDIFNAFKFCPLDRVKVFLLGQDPYHGPGQAHGLSFSVPSGTKIPPSLTNIFKELKSDLDVSCRDGCLIPWATQGVLLLNNTLTVREGQPNSHKDFGWNYFTDHAIAKINSLDRPIVYLLWGSFAKTKQSLITNPKHLVLTSAHPSPLSAHQGFLGSKPFSKTNNYLLENNLTAIDWQL